jgi:signal transduction histidine kinase
MSRVLFIRHEILDDLDLEQIEAQSSDFDFVGVDDHEAMRSALEGEGFDALLLPYRTSTEANAAQFSELLDAYPRVSVICVVDDGDHRAASEVAAHRPTDFLFAEQLRSAYAATMLEAIIDRVASQSREARLQHELERRNSELLGLNALASAVSSSLSRGVIIRRALWVFAGLCRRGAVALFQIDPAPALPEEFVPSREQSGEELSVQCAGEFAVDGAAVCAEIDAPGKWLDVIHDDEILLLDASIDRDEFPGLTPLIDRLGDGILTLVPIWGQGRALGLLVLADLAGGKHMPFTREGLRAMVSQLGGALENARLFEEVNGAYGSLKSTQDQLVHAEKFAAMGVLAAEIAHEINNPASFVISNLSVMVDYVQTIGEFLEHLHEQVDRHAPSLLEVWEELAADHEIAFLREDLDILLSRSLGGMQRIHQIVQDLRFFSHDTANEPGWIDVESLLDSTLNLVKHEAKYRAQLVLDFGEVPQVFSDANRLSQVFLNLLVNAAHSIHSGTLDENLIRVTTKHLGDTVEVLVSDTGQGISEDVLPRIFDPFFTTKEPGEGTGLGLSIARDIVRSLGGEISVSSELGRGSTFKVTLPIRATKFETDPDIRDSGSFTAPRLGHDTDGSRKDGRQDEARKHLEEDQ